MSTITISTNTANSSVTSTNGSIKATNIYGLTSTKSSSNLTEIRE